MTALGPRTVEIDVARPYAPLLGELAMFPIVSPAAVRQWGDAFRHHPVGTGAVRVRALGRRRAGRRPAVRRATGAPRPPLERIVFRVVIDARQRLIDLQSGSVDLAAAILPDEQSFVELHPDLVLHHTPSNDVSYLAFNMQHPPFDDARVRRAISHAINKEPIVKLAYQGRAIAADGPLPPAQWGYHVPQTRYAYDPALATQAARRGGRRPRVRSRRGSTSCTRRRRRAPYLSQPERVARYLQAALDAGRHRTPSSCCSRIDEHQRRRSSPASTTSRCSAGSATPATPTTSSTCCSHSDNAVPGSAQNIAFYRNPTRRQPADRRPGRGRRAERSELYAAGPGSASPRTRRGCRSRTPSSWSRRAPSSRA